MFIGLINLFISYVYHYMVQLLIYVSELGMMQPVNLIFLPNGDDNSQKH